MKRILTLSLGLILCLCVALSLKPAPLRSHKGLRQNPMPSELDLTSLFSEARLRGRSLLQILELEGIKPVVSFYNADILQTGEPLPQNSTDAIPPTHPEEHTDAMDRLADHLGKSKVVGEQLEAALKQIEERVKWGCD